MKRIEAARKVAERILAMSKEELQYELLRQEDTDTYLIFKKLQEDQKWQQHVEYLKDKHERLVEACRGDNKL